MDKDDPYLKHAATEDIVDLLEKVSDYAGQVRLGA